MNVQVPGSQDITPYDLINGHQRFENLVELLPHTLFLEKFNIFVSLYITSLQFKVPEQNSIRISELATK